MFLTGILSVCFKKDIRRIFYSVKCFLFCYHTFQVNIIAIGKGNRVINDIPYFFINCTDNGCV